MADDEQVEEAEEPKAKVTFARCTGSGEMAGAERMTNLTERRDYGRCGECSLMVPVTKAGKLKGHEAPRGG